MTKPLVYVAGPISSDPLTHTRIAVHTYVRLIRDDVVVPACPHLSVFAEMIAPLPYAEWLRHDFDLIRRCDAVFRLPGESNGADAEVEFALSLGMPVFLSERGLYEWARGNIGPIPRAA